MSHKLGLVVKTDETRIQRTAEQIEAGKVLGRKIRDLIQENLAEIGANIVQGKPYDKRNGLTVVNYMVQGTLNCPALTFDDGSGEMTTRDWFLNFTAQIPTERAETPNAGDVQNAPVRAMTIAEARAAMKAGAHK